MAVDKFSFRVEGQPLSWNASYRMGIRKVYDRFGQPVLAKHGGQLERSQQFKSQKAKDYQGKVEQAARDARPATFQPKHQVVVAYEFELSRMMDCDNIMKMLNDAIAKALGINDSRFLPVTLSKVGASKSPRVTVYVFDGDFAQPEVITHL